MNNVITRVLQHICFNPRNIFVIKARCQRTTEQMALNVGLSFPRSLSREFCYVKE